MLMSNSKNLDANGLGALLGSGMGSLGAALGQQHQSELMVQQQMAYINNNHNGYWLTSGIVAPTISAGTTIFIDAQPTPATKKRDEFAWLRARVEETCWREAA